MVITARTQIVQQSLSFLFSFFKRFVKSKPSCVLLHCFSTYHMYKVIISFSMFSFSRCFHHKINISLGLFCFSLFCCMFSLLFPFSACFITRDSPFCFRQDITLFTFCMLLSCCDGSLSSTQTNQEAIMGLFLLYIFYIVSLLPLHFSPPSQICIIFNSMYSQDNHNKFIIMLNVC